LAVGLVALIWYYIPSSGSTDIASDAIDTGMVERRGFEDYLPIRASVAPQLTTLIGALSGGQVERLLVQDGTHVDANQPLATLSNPVLKLEVLTREAAIASQLGQLTGDELAMERSRIDRASQTNEASYDVIKAQRDLAIRQQLQDQGFLSEEGVKSYHAEADYQRDRLAQLRAGQAKENQTAQIQASRLGQARRQLNDTLSAVRASMDALVIRAPAAGRLTNFTVQPGQTLKAGDSTGQIDSEGVWKLVADVDEFYLGRAQIGQPATANGMRLTVAKVLPAVTNGRFRIELGFVGQSPQGLNRGQTVDARVTLGKSGQAVVAPVGGWLESGGGVSAFVLDSNGRHARRRVIRAGRRNPEFVEILSGLNPGEQIITSNTASVTGDIINIG
jgi:HlyD family secretion protein